MAGDWLADLIAVGEQARVVLRRHRWLAGLSITRPVIGPHGLALMEHVLNVLRPHPADAAAKMEAFAMLNGVTAAFVLQELIDTDLWERNLGYLQHAIASGQRPRLAEFIAQPPTAPDMNPVDRYPGPDGPHPHRHPRPGLVSQRREHGGNCGCAADPAGEKGGAPETGRRAPPTWPPP